MALIKNGQSTVDLWRTIADKESIPADGPVIISLKRWTEEKPWLKGRNATGEIRAVGDVLRDQLAFMQRCGINSFEVAENIPIDKWIKAIGEISVVYQPATDARQTALDKRRNA